MVSNISFYSFKDFDLRNRVPFVAVLGSLLVIVLMTLDPPRVLFGGFLLYALSGPVLWAGVVTDVSSGVEKVWMLESIEHFYCSVCCMNIKRYLLFFSCLRLARPGGVNCLPGGGFHAPDYYPTIFLPI